MSSFSLWLPVAFATFVSSAACARAEGMRLAGTLFANPSTCSQQPREELLGAALLSAVIGPAVEAGIKGIGAALANASKDTTSDLSGDVAGYFYKIRANQDDPYSALQASPKGNICVLIAAGTGSGSGEIPEVDAAVRLRLKELGFSQAPKFFLLSSVDISTDGTAWRLVPFTLYVGTPFSKRSGFRSSDRELVLQVTLFGPTAKTGDDAAVATRSVLLSGFANGAVGKVQNVEEVMYLGTSWMPLPPIPQSIATQISDANQRRLDYDNLSQKLAEIEQDIASAKEKDKAALLRKKSETQQLQKKLEKQIGKDGDALKFESGVGPFVLNFHLVETRDGSKFVNDVAKFLSDNSETIAKPISDSISPAARQAARDAELQKSLAAADSEKDARVAAIEAVGAWQASVDAAKPASEQSALRVKALFACRKLELQLFAETECVDLK